MTIKERLRATTMRELIGLRRRMLAVEEAAAENRLLRPELARLVDEVEDRVEAFERGPSHGAGQAAEG